MLFEHDDVVPALSEHSRRRGAGRSGPNHDYITHHIDHRFNVAYRNARCRNVRRGWPQNFRSR
jgi:hypothetical protein